jgi:hypothetical protein
VKRAACLLLLVACSKGSAKPAETVEASIPDPFLAPPYSAEPGASAGESPVMALSAPAASTGTSAPGPRSSVKLLDPGQEPLRPLHYAWHADQKERMEIELRTAISADLGGAKKDSTLPPLHIVVAIEPRSVTPAGDLRFAWHVESARPGLPEAGAPEAMMAGWSAQLVPVERLSGTALVNAHGVSRGVTLDGGTAGDAGADSEMVVQVLQMLRDVAAPLPDEPVGKGARWQKLSTLDAKNGHATQTDTYTLLGASSDTGSLDDVFAQTASPQALPSPTAGGVSPATVDSLLTSGNAKVHFDLSRLVPQQTLDGTTSMALSAPSSRMNMVMRLGITVKGSLAGALSGPQGRDAEPAR